MLRLVTNEASSGISALIMLQFVRHWLSWYPPSLHTWFTTLWIQALGALIFSAGHIAVFMVLRSGFYWLIGLTYVHALGEGLSGLVKVFLYEASKDLPLYLGMALIVSLYRNWRSAHFAGRDQYPDTFLASRGKREKLIRTADIDFFQAAANYVAVWTGGEEYLVRSTMAGIEQQLDPKRFVRVHRSYIVSLDAVDELLTPNPGQQVIKLRSGEQIPCGRNYRARLGALLESS